MDNTNRKYVIYRILNTVTGKSYVGMTISLQQRYSEHINKLENNKHHSIKLQQAFNEHGCDAFVWEILESDLSKNDAIEKEIDWIKRLNTRSDGYNMTDGGEGVLYTGWHDKPTVWNGIKYKSLSDAAKAVGISKSSMESRLAKGRTCDADMQPKKERVIRRTQPSFVTSIPQDGRKPIDLVSAIKNSKIVPK